MIYWGQDFIENCSDAPKNLIERNNDWWTRYSDRIQKFKEKMESVSKCNWNTTQLPNHIMTHQLWEHNIILICSGFIIAHLGKPNLEKLMVFYMDDVIISKVNREAIIKPKYVTCKKVTSWSFPLNNLITLRNKNNNITMHVTHPHKLIALMIWQKYVLWHLF